ncbi:LSU ribosomal protein L35e (L29p) [Thermofilum adornatum 1505]|nr:LSU ribosomal protein L35e (L29p) [Thermofilum adornatum 1505]
MTREEREKRLQELRAELARLKAQAHRGSLENPSSIRKIKREIARILTVMNEEKLGISKSQVAATAEKQ